MSIRLSMFMMLLCVSVIASPALFAEEAKKPSSPKIKNSTAEVKIKNVTAEIKIEKKQEEKQEEKQVKKAVQSKAKAKPQSLPITDQSEVTENKTGDIHIHNYGIQATFINSNVTVSGGTVISGEINKTEGVPPAVVKEGSAQDGKPAAKPGQKQPTKPKKPGKYKTLIKDATKASGLFTTYSKKVKDVKKLYWEISPKQLDKEFLYSGVLSTGVGTGWAKSGFHLGGMIIQFHKHNGKIQLVQKHNRLAYDKDSTQATAIRKNFSDSIIASLPIDATNPETSGMIIDMSKVMMADLFDVSGLVRSSLRSGYSLDRTNSEILESNVLPQNIVTKIHFAFRSGSLFGSNALPDSRSASIDFIIDIRPLNENPGFESRIADPRIGYFIEAQMDFSTTTSYDRFLRNIIHWDIRKASPEEKLSPPIKKITFWLDNATPKKYRKSIISGVLEWNKAFKKIGILDPIDVKMQPDDSDWDTADARYNTIHWNETYDGMYVGLAQFLPHPRTGEIIYGGFIMEGEGLRGIANLRRVQEVDAITAIKNILAIKPLDQTASHEEHLCADYQNQMLEQSLGALTMLAAKEGISSVTGEVLDKFIDDYVHMIAMHEFGHVLGLRHNFKGSTMLTLEELQDPAITKKKSVTNSVMEYLPPNFPPVGQEQVDYFPSTIGPYDYLAIEYGYKPLKATKKQSIADLLGAIAERGETKEMTYGTDEDVTSGMGPGIDPLCNRWDLGDDPLAYAKLISSQALDTIPRLPNLIQDGDDYSLVRSGLNRMLNYHFNGAGFALKHLGGMYVNRVKKGGANNKLPFEPVSVARQREALNYLLETTFSNKIFEIEPELANMLAPAKWYHWGQSSSSTRTEFPLYAIATNLYDQVLYNIFYPGKLRNIMDGNIHRREEETAFTIPEVFRTVQGSVWKELSQFRDKGSIDLGDQHVSNKKPFISNYRRILQRAHLKRMIEIMLEPPVGIPEDARTQAWRSLTELEKQLNSITQASNIDDLDDYSKDHLMESLMKVKRVLNAQTNARVDFW